MLAMPTPLHPRERDERSNLREPFQGQTRMALRSTDAPTRGSESETALDSRPDRRTPVSAHPRSVFSWLLNTAVRSLSPRSQSLWHQPLLCSKRCVSTRLDREDALLPKAHQDIFPQRRWESNRPCHLCRVSTNHHRLE